MSRTALFTIDIQHALAHPPSGIPSAPRILHASSAILALARAAIDTARQQDLQPTLDIVIVQHEETPEKGCLVRGSKEWEVVFPAREGDGNEWVVGKSVRDTFASNPGLADQLRERGVGTVVAYGIQSECCVKSTCLGALEAGFKVVLLRGAHSTYDARERTAGQIEGDVEEELRGLGVRVLEWDAWTP